MRNLKRVLSLALALVMMLGMMIITTSAAGATKIDFADADEITKNEAVDVMVALGVLEGDGTNFNPTDILTREQAAKIICYMLMGPANAEKLAGTTIFSDVAATRWSAGFITYCANLGYIAGNGDGTFDPAGQLTDVAFGKMLLVALGYDAEIEGYVNNKNWATNIGADMIEAGINDGAVLGTAITREQAAQLAFNTLKADVVTYTNKGTNITMADGTTVVMGASPASKPNYANTYMYNSVADNVQQFCEKQFPTLSLNNTTAVDGMGRPANSWSYMSLPVGTYAKTAAFTTVAAPKMPAGTEPKAADVVDTISKSLNDSTATLVVNGAAGTYASDNIKIGSDVEIYLNQNGTVNKVVVTEYSAATVLAATATKTEKGVDYISISGVTPGYVKAETVKGDTDLSKFDVVLYYKDADDVYTIEKAASVTGKVSGNHSTKGLLVDGTYYPDSAITNAANIWSNDYTNSWTFYLDHANRIVKAVQVTDDMADNYVAVAEVAWVEGSGVDGTNYVEARIVKADASTEVVKIASVNGVSAIAKDADLADGLYYNNSGTKAATSSSTAVAGKFYYQKNSVNEGVAGVTLTAKFFGVSDTDDLTTAAADSTLKVDGSNNFVADTAAAFITEGSIYAYELDKDGNYKLSTTANGNDSWATVNATIKGSSDTANVGAPSNDSTVFVYAVTTNGTTKYTAYTGYANAPKATSVATTARTIVKGNDGFAKLVYVATSSVAGTFDADLVYVADNANLAKKVGTQTVYVYDGLIINGVAGSMTLTDSTLTEGIMYVVTGSNATTGAKTLTDIGNAGTDDDGFVDTDDAQVGISANGGNTIVIGSNTYTYTDETVAYYIDADGNSTQISADAIGLDATDDVYVVVDQTVATKAVKIYVVETTNAPSTLTVTVNGGGSCTANSNNDDLIAGTVGVTGATLGTTTLDVATAGDSNMSYTVTIKGNSNASVAKSGSSASVGAAATASGYATVAANEATGVTADSVITVTVTATDGFSGAQSVYTYTFTIGA